MARIRTIKPQHWNDRELSKISLSAHLLWIGTWNFSDDEGVFENDPLLIRSNIFPRRTDIRVEQVSQWLDQLVKARFIIPFTHDGIGYYIHRTFKTHQKIDKPQKSKIPEEVIRRLFSERSESVQPCIVMDSNVKESSVVAANESPPPGEKISIKKSERKKVKEKNATAEPFWQELVDAWFSFIKKQFGDEPSFTRDEPKILKRIINLLKKRAEAKQVEWNEKNAVSRFTSFLERAFEDNWLAQNFLLSNLEKQFDKIILNNKQHANSNGKNGQGGLYQRPVIDESATTAGKF